MPNASLSVLLILNCTISILLIYIPYLSSFCCFSFHSVLMNGNSSQTSLLSSCVFLMLLMFFVCDRTCVSHKDCFSMTNVSWYGGASVRGQTWPINDQNATMQPFIVSDLKDNPSGFGSVLERYFLGSSGKRSLLGLVILISLINVNWDFLWLAKVESYLFTPCSVTVRKAFKSFKWHRVNFLATLAISVVLAQGLRKSDPT